MAPVVPEARASASIGPIGRFGWCSGCSPPVPFGPTRAMAPAPSSSSRAIRQAFSGDAELRASGWRRGVAEPPWRVAQDDAVPCTILSVTSEIMGNT